VTRCTPSDYRANCRAHSKKGLPPAPPSPA
jgi:hypothetical protein